MSANYRLALCACLSALGALCASAASQADEQTDNLVASYNDAGFSLFERLAAAPGNLVVSPYSIGTAMAMAYAGARGETAAQMAKALNESLTPEQIADANQALNALVSDRPDEKDVKISLANALHLTTFGALVSKSYKQMLSEKFAAELFTGSDLPAINTWVREKTNGKIDEILKRLDPYSVCVILNAIYFKAPWASPFSTRSTASAPFHLSQNETIEVPMMRCAGPYRVLRAHMFDAIALPYAGDKLSMIILLPMRLAGPGQVAISLTNKTIASVVQGLRKTQPEQIQLSMPKFKTEFSANLIPPFRSLGMTLAFDKDRADFSGITDSTRESDSIHISQIQHKTMIDVDEAGTEAAAATAVEFAKRAAPPRATVKVDRPFYYLIADETSGAILFLGRLSDPRKG